MAEAWLPCPAPQRCWTGLAPIGTARPWNAGFGAAAWCCSHYFGGLGAAGWGLGQLPTGPFIPTKKTKARCARRWVLPVGPHLPQHERW